MEGGIPFRDEIILNYEEHEIRIVSSVARNIQKISICVAESSPLIEYVVVMTCFILLTSSSLTNFLSSKNFFRVPKKRCENLTYICTRDAHCLMTLL